MPHAGPDAPTRSEGWPNTLRLAGDLALLGIVVTALSLPLLTAGAAVGAGSAALHQLVRENRWPSAADLWREFRVRLRPGLPAGPAVLAGAALVALDVAALRRGAVPGGGAVLAVLVVAVLLVAGWGALVVVAFGAAPRGPCRTAFATVVTRPGRALVAAGLIVVAGLLGGLVHPLLGPVVVGYALFALHVVGRRWELADGRAAPVDHQGQDPLGFRVAADAEEAAGFGGRHR